MGRYNIFTFPVCGVKRNGGIRYDIRREFKSGLRNLARGPSVDVYLSVI